MIPYKETGQASREQNVDTPPCERRSLLSFSPSFAYMPSWGAKKFSLDVTFLLPYVVLVVIHVALGWRMEQPHIFGDELGYLGNARYLAGVASLPDMSITIFYHFGYSLFLIPVFWLFSDPVLAYKAAIVTNAFLISLLYVALYYILHRCFGNPRRISMLIAFVTCLYPAFLLQANLAWAESAFIPVYAFFIAAFGVFLHHQSYGAAGLFGLLTGFLYTIHPRGLPGLPITALFLYFLSQRKILPKFQTRVSIACIVIVFVVTALVNDHLRSLGWGGRGQISSVALLSGMFSTAGMKNLLLAIAGQVLYLAQATYGLFLLGLLYICLDIWRDGMRTFIQQNDRQRKVLILILVLLSSLGVLLASCLVVTVMGGTRSDHFIYGRYNEGFVALYIALALTMLRSEQYQYLRNTVSPSLVVSIIGVLTLAVVIGRGDALLSLPAHGSHIFGIYPAIRELGRLDLSVISLTAIVLFLAIEGLLKRKFISGLCAILFCFVVVSAYGYKFYIAAAQTHFRHTNTLVSQIRQLGEVPSISYDMSFYNDKNPPVRFFSYQYLLPNIVFKRFYSHHGEVPTSPVVISGKYWQDAGKLQARFVAVENGADQALWVLPGAIQARLPQPSYIDAVLGAKPVPGVWESGFHGQEWNGKGSFRWTNGKARLVVPINKQRPPTKLSVELASITPKRATLRLLVNGTELFNGRTSAGGENQIFSLAGCPLEDHVTIELVSNTFVPKETIKGSQDTRTLGVAVRAIRLLEGEKTLSETSAPNAG